MAAVETQGDRILTQFSHFDQNGDGSIDRQELLTILQGFDPVKWTDERVDGILVEADLKKDGVIHYKEFVAWVSKDGKDQADFLKAADVLAPEAIEGLVRSLSNHSATSGKGDLVGALEALHQVPWEKKEPAVATLLKILQNTAKDPSNPKFRRLKTTNAVLQAKVFAVPGCAELLMASGFEVDGDDLVLPDGVDVSWVVEELGGFGNKELLDQRRAERDAKIEAAKAEEAKGKALKGHNLGGSPEDRKRLLEKIEYDRQERLKRDELAAEGYHEQVFIPAEKNGGDVPGFKSIGVDLDKGGG